MKANVPDSPYDHHSATLWYKFMLFLGHLLYLWQRVENGVKTVNQPCSGMDLHHN